MTEQDAVQAARSGVIAAAEAHSARRYALGKGYRSDGVHIGEQGTAELSAALDVLVAVVKAEALRKANRSWVISASAAVQSLGSEQSPTAADLVAAEAELAAARQRMEAS